MSEKSTDHGLVENQLAFPFVEPFEGTNIVHLGMSLRDYFAAAALQGKLTNGYHGSEASAAAGAYAYADAMLAARNKEIKDD